MSAKKTNRKSLLMLMSYQNKNIHIGVVQDKTPQIRQTISFIRNSCLDEPSKIPKCCYMLYIQLYTSKCNVTMSKLFLCCMEQWHYY